MKSASKGLKIKHFFSNRRNVVIVIAVVSFLIIILVGVFFWMIYTKDEPSFVPEETKGKIRKGIEDTVGDNVKKVAPDLGQSIIDASFDNQAKSPTTSGTNAQPESQLNLNTDPTAGWLVYSSPAGFKIKYPPTLTSVQTNLLAADQTSSVSFWTTTKYKGPQNGSFSEFDFDTFVTKGNQTASEWINSKNQPTGMITGVTISGGWIKATEAGDPDHFIYVKAQNGKVFQLTTSLTPPGYIDEVLESFSSI